MGVLWDTWTDGHEHMESCVLLTQPANEDCRDVHDRMPVIIEQDRVEDWLSGGVLPPEPESGRIKRHPVDRAVNRIGEDHPGWFGRFRDCSIRSTERRSRPLV